ncbi:lysophospholipid acyltransferase family protein [Thermomonas sp. HDW16]|uniref:GNAT family N-acyltransferase n=1 Tax=Thermomonas sp. HDW16 TaxID=2714945 RepID=UPI00140B5B75|nr:lysophospholipid acyltransferase family protein [Thermomonas sp. HDW16]QIL19952.1 GNAT family N-acetyltransferase [Thermomonas sp. HDW16]
MIQLEQRLQQRFPQWFRGRRAAIAKPLLRGIERWSRLDVIDAFLAANRTVRGFALIAAALQFLGARYEVDDAALARIPAQGRLLVIANHPSGALDALALLDAVGKVRRDVRIVANDVLSALDNIGELLLPVRILGGRPSADSLRAVDAALARGECVIVFPAGEVSRLGPRGVRDTRWRRGFLRFARACDAPVLPVRIQARNSALFYGASALFKPAGTALLAREMFARRARRIVLRVGQLRRIPSDVDGAAVLKAIRRELYAIGTRNERSVPVNEAGPEPIADAIDPAVVRAGIDAMHSLGATSDGKQIRVGALSADAPLLREIGRLRELTFRAVGEGTGRSLDVDAWDSWYEHIVLWDDAASKIAGAYRIARGAPVLAAHGIRGLYTASLFDYADDAIARIAQGMELGRSFVAPEYWGGRSIDYLWQGIGAYLRAYPKVRYLFGAVSISAALPVTAREQIAAHYAHYFGASGEAISKRPFAYGATMPHDAAMDADTAFRVLKANLDALGAQVPMLYKQYTELCEPGGARFLAFGVDPDFSDAVDGLIEVDIQRMRAKKRQRYLGETPHGIEAVA